MEPIRNFPLEILASDKGGTIMVLERDCGQG
jgi:hypothetical protein